MLFNLVSQMTKILIFLLAMFTGTRTSVSGMDLFQSQHEGYDDIFPISLTGLLYSAVRMWVLLHFVEQQIAFA